MMHFIVRFISYLHSIGVYCLASGAFRELQNSKSKQGHLIPPSPFKKEESEAQKEEVFL